MNLIFYCLIDDKHTPSTLSSSYRLPESTTSAATSNIRSRNTNLTTNTTTNRMETQPVKPTSTTTTKSNEVASKGIVWFEILIFEKILWV